MALPRFIEKMDRLLKATNMNKNQLLEIAREFGTPLYVYDASVIKKQVTVFKKAFRQYPLQIRYAMKSNSNINILKLMRQEGLGLDTVSIPEIKIGLLAGFRPEQIVFTPNMVDFEEIVVAVDIGVYINIENLSNLEKFGKKYGSKKSCCLRLNPDIVTESESDKVEKWHSQSKFGIALSQMGELFEIVRKYNMSINGIHIHSSHVIMSPEVFLKGAKILFDLAEKFPELEYVDFGGGIKVAHQSDEKVIDINELGSAMKALYDEFCTRMNKKVQLWFEPGRYLVGESGYLLVDSKVLKTNGSKIFVGVDSGFSHLIRPMFYNAYHEIENLSNPSGELKKYNVVGNLCEIDNFAVDRTLNEVREGDFLVIRHTGAYGFCMSSQYNSRFRPAEVMILDGKPQLIRKREIIDDLLKNQVEIEY